MAAKTELKEGERYWNLIVIKEVWRNKHWKRIIKCKCDCWSECECLLNRMRSWATRSCWCYRKKQLIKRNKLDVELWKVYGRLTIVEEAEPHPQPNGKMIRRFKCDCSCWNITIARLSDLVQWATKSCWCLHKEIITEKSTTHWQSSTRLYNVRAGIKARCYDKSSQDYIRYWARWITVNNRRHKFENFYEDMLESYNTHFEKHWVINTTIDRIDNNWNYVKSNCRRATQKTQANNKNNNVLISYWWYTRNLTQRSEELWVTLNKLFRKVREKWYTHKQALKEYIDNK